MMLLCLSCSGLYDKLFHYYKNGPGIMKVYQEEKDRLYASDILATS